MIDITKLTFSTLGCPELEFDEILSLASSYQMKSVELRGIKSNVRINSLPELLPESRDITKKKLTASGVSLCLLGCSAQMHTGRAEAAAECGYASDAANEFGIPYIRVFGNRCNNEAMFDYAVESLSEVCHNSEQKGVTVLLEAHGDYNSSDIILKLFNAVGADNLGLLWDIEHTHAAGENEKEFSEKMIKYIRHVHLKNVTTDGTLCLPSKGVIDIGETIDALESIGYSGLYSLEWEKRWHPELPDIKTALDDLIELVINRRSA